MILKRLKLFTAGLPGTPSYKFSNYDSVMNNNNNSAANTNSAGGSSVNTAPAAANNANAGNSNAANKSGSVTTISGGTKTAVPFKNANDKVTFDSNNVKLDKDALINKLTQQNSQLQSKIDGANNIHQQELAKTRVESAARGRAAGRKQVGVWQGMKNTWNKAGTMKKIGIGGAALAGTYLIGKGLLGGNNSDNNQQ